MKITLIVALCFVGSGWFFSAKENQRLQFQATLNEQREKLNEDQIRDMEWQLTNARTYDEGFHDAIMYGNSKGYVDGYHKAIGQNQEHIQYLQAKLDDLATQEQNTQIVEQQ